MKVAYCSWGESSTTDLLRGLQALNYEVVNIVYCVKDFLSGVVEENLYKQIDEKVDCVISFDFFPIVSKVCEKKQIPYISWVYDWPNYTLFDPAIYNECNRVFLFERQGIAMLSRYRVSNLEYEPLAVDAKHLSSLFDDSIKDTNYLYEVSFVGNMYHGLCGAMMTDHIPAYYEGFVKGLASAQRKINGYNLVNEIIDKPFVDEYLRAIHLEIPGTFVPKEYILSTQINRYITGVERKELLLAVAKQFDTHLFTQEKNLELENVSIHCGVNYNTEMPVVFRKSKINLNITLRSITSGVPLRVYDILGSGGFCLTNYQEGILEHFTDGEDLVIFYNEQDLMEKIHYYLEHEEERMKIAQHGYETVLQYNYESALKKMIDAVLNV
ncbi:MAG: glycosyltransferase [Lachnospiraceae bacterium]